MRPKVLEIAWHETQAVYSCDFQPLPLAQLKRLLPTTDEDEAGKKDKEDKTPTPVVAGGRQYRLATAGGDSKVRLWMIHPNIPAASASTHAAVTGQEIAPHPPRAEYLSTLSKHTAAVNVVRFSPNGQTLASAGDDGNVILWVQSDRPVASFGESSEDLPDKEHWRLQKMLQVTTKHVYDLAWSPDGEFFIAGSTDNTATIWKASTGECVFALREHSHNVQGVAWDPLNEYIATQSSDRSVHVNTFQFRNGVSDVHPVSRTSRMEIRHSRTPSLPGGPRPGMVRRGSTTSETGSVITSASEHTDLPNPSGHHAGAPMTPSTSVPSTPQPAVMNPPPSTKPGSRRSSFSGSQAAGSPALSAAAPFPGRGRSPSPIPPLPAIRAPPISSQAIMQRLYGEEGVTRFFRRLSFSPDGSLLFTPAGQIEDQLFKGSPMLSARSLSQDGGETPTPSSVPRPKNVDNGRPTVYIYGRANLARAPIAHLPGHKTASVAIRFSPVFYDLRTAPTEQQAEPKHVTLDRSEGPVQVSLSMPPPPPPSKDKDKEKEKEKDKEKEDKDRSLGSVFALPYRLLYAVACQDAVLLYDTQQAGPIAIFKGLHYAGFTDIAWSPDGQALMLSSADGYCSIVVFDLGELGSVHPTQQHHRQLAAIAQHHNHPTPHRDSVSHLPSGATHRDSLSSTPIPHSPAFSTMRQSPAPARSEREGSTSSSIAAFPIPPQSTSLPLFTPNPSQSYPPPPSSSSSDVVLPTPSLEEEGFNFRRASESERSVSVPVSVSVSASAPPSTAASSSGIVPPQTGASNVGLGLTPGGEELKRAAPSPVSAAAAAAVGNEDGQAKKKRRVALTHLGDEEA